MHVTITAPTFNRTWLRLGWFKGEWWESWDVKCTIIFTEEEKLQLKQFDESFILYTDKWEFPDQWHGDTIRIPVPLFVEQAANAKPRSYPSRAHAEAYIDRLKREILPRLKDLTENPRLSKGESFEL